MAAVAMQQTPTNEFSRTSATDGETLTDVAQRLGIAFSKGTGFYALIKGEKVSARKELVLEKASGSWSSSWNMDTATVRSELGLGGGDVTIMPALVPAGCTLFVQSTSVNRKLAQGQGVLFKGSGPTSIAAAASVAAGSSSASPAPTKSKKRNARDGELDGGGGEGGGGEGGGGEGGDRLIFDLAHEVECLDEDDLVAGASASGVPGDCDLPIPIELVQRAVEGVTLAMTRVDDWELSDELTVPIPARHSFYTPPPARRLQWRSAAAGGARLMYVEAQEETRFVALELREPPFGLVAGSCGAHPFVHSTAFKYANSDGSTSDRALGEVVLPAVVLAKLIHDTVMHASDVEH